MVSRDNGDTYAYTRRALVVPRMHTYAMDPPVYVMRNIYFHLRDVSPQLVRRRCTKRACICGEAEQAHKTRDQFDLRIRASNVLACHLDHRTARCIDFSRSNSILKALCISCQQAPRRPAPAHHPTLPQSPDPQSPAQPV